MRVGPQKRLSAKELDHKKGWVPKNWCFQLVLEKTLKSSLDYKETKRANPKRNQPWILIGRTHVETEAPILWPPAIKSWLIGKDLDPGKDWRQKKKEAAEDKMVGWHHQLNGHELEWTLGNSEGQAMDMNLNKLWEVVKGKEVWRAAVHKVAKSQTQLSDWKTKTINGNIYRFFFYVVKKKWLNTFQFIQRK